LILIERELRAGILTSPARVILRQRSSRKGKLVPFNKSLATERLVGLRDVTWRAPAPRWRRSVPRGFIRPCEPALVAYPPTGPEWSHEIKHDGFRILAWKQGERVNAWRSTGQVDTRFHKCSGLHKFK
jgi:bifunctional non-homologous end joining protein LigD